MRRSLSEGYGMNDKALSTLQNRPQGLALPAVQAAGVVFHLSRVTRVYRMGETEIHALRNIDLDLKPAEFVVLLGASGSGKSTLLNILGGLDRPSSGEVRYRDHDLACATPAELTRFRREHVGFVFQFYNLIPSLTAYENVALVTEIADKPMDPDAALERVGMAGRRNHFPSQLSGGEQQRVAIARAIVKRPDVLLCDEPTGALDYPTGKLVLSVLQRVNQELGTITVVITHNAAIAAMADRVIRISSGQIVDIQCNTTKASPEDISW
jgi:putative ABC transport system ATP-binding protein